MRRYLASPVPIALVWFAFFLGIAVGLVLASDSEAAQLEARAHYLGPFRHTVETLVTVDVRAKRPGTAELIARGLLLPNLGVGQKEDAYTATVRLREGRNRFRRRFYVARWDFAAPGWGAALRPWRDRLVVQELNAVSVELEVAGRARSAIVQVGPHAW